MNTILTTADVAERLGVEPDTIKNYVREGKLSAAKLGSVWVFTNDSLVADITRLIQEQDKPAVRAVQVKPIRPNLAGL